MDWLSDLFSGFGDFFGGINDFLGFDVTDIITSAGLNAVVAGVAGGDIGEAALYGAAGGALSESGLLGEYSNLAGTTLQGYGLDRSLGGNGLLGAAGGAALSMLNGNAGNPTAGNPQGNANVAQNGSSFMPGEDELRNRVGGGGGLMDILSPNADGQYSDIAKTLLGAAGGYANSENQEDILEAAAKLRRESDQFNSDLDREEYDHAAESDFNTKMNNVARFG